MFHLGRTLKNLIKPFINISRRKFQVSVVGASLPLGRSVSLLLKNHALIHRLSMYDTPKETNGVVKDLCHIPTEPVVEGWTGRMEFALLGCDLVVVTGGQSKKLGQTDGCLFKENAEFIISSMQEILKYCPKAFIIIATEPINYTIPLASKVLESIGDYDKCKVLGVTGADTMKAQMWVSKIFQLPPNETNVPVICGNSSKTTLPLLSNIMPHFAIDDCSTSTIIEAVRNDGEDIVTSYLGKSTLSAAYATYCMASTILDAINGIPKEHVAFVANDHYGTKFFASTMIIKTHGISAIQQLKYSTALEADYFYHARKQLTTEVRSAESYFVPTIYSHNYAKPKKKVIDHNIKFY